MYHLLKSRFWKMFSLLVFFVPSNFNLSAFSRNPCTDCAVEPLNISSYGISERHWGPGARTEKGNGAVRGLWHRSYEEWLREMGWISLERGAQGRPLYSDLNGCCGEKEVGLFSQVTVIGWEGTASGLPGRFKLGMRKSFSSKRVVGHWHSEVMESLSLEVLRSWGDVVLRDIVGGEILVVGGQLDLDDLRGIFLNDSMIFKKIDLV